MTKNHALVKFLKETLSNKLVRIILADFKNVSREQTKARKNRKKRCNAEKEQDCLAPPPTRMKKGLLSLRFRYSRT